MLALDDSSPGASRAASRAEDEASSATETTLYDLMSAMQAEVEPGEEDLVVVAIVRMLLSGRIKLYRNLTDHDRIV